MRLLLTGSLRALMWLGIAILLFAAVRRGYSHPWTGFGQRPSLNAGVEAAKTLWDWLELLIVPLVLAAGAVLIESSRRRADALEARDKQAQAVLDDYFKCLTDLLVEQRLDSAIPARAASARAVARTRTLSALRLLDGKRKAALVQFLAEAGLIGSNPHVELNGADLSGAELSGANLAGCELRGVHFQDSVCVGTNFNDADLRASDFTRADWREVRARNARLDQVRFVGATLDRVDAAGASIVQIDWGANAPLVVSTRLPHERSERND